MDSLKLLKFVKTNILALSLFVLLLGVISILLTLTPSVISTGLKTSLLVTTLSIFTFLGVYLIMVFNKTMKMELTEEEKSNLSQNSGLH